VNKSLVKEEKLFSKRGQCLGVIGYSSVIGVPLLGSHRLGLHFGQVALSVLVSGL
jgi:hypothetical protein